MVGLRRVAEKTYGVLAESKGHVLGITTNLDVDSSKLSEDLSDRNLKSLITLGLKKTGLC